MTPRQGITSLQFGMPFQRRGLMSVRARSRAFVLFASIAGVFGAATAVFPHHGSFISYDTTKQWTKKVVVTEFHYANPHPQLFFDVADDKGNVENWGAELLPNPAQLINNGWSRKRPQEDSK